MMELDHIAISGETRAAATEYVERALGVPLQMGGEHPHFGTHNTLLGLEDGLYLEAIAVDPDAPKPAYPRWFGLDDFGGVPRVTNWIVRVPDIEAVVRDMPEAGEIIALERGDLRWRMAVPKSGALPFHGCFPAIIQWDGPHPAPRLTQQGVALTSLTITHPEAAALEAKLSPVLDAPLVSFVVGEVPELSACLSTPEGGALL